MSSWRRAAFRWSPMAWLVLVIGVIASVVAGSVWRSQQREHVRRSFAAEAAGVGSAVTTSLFRMDDLIIDARTLIAESDTTNAALTQWYSEVDAARRYPGIIGFGYIRLIRAHDLPAFSAALKRDPIPGLPVAGKTLQIEPGGHRPYYCLARLAVAGAIDQFLLAPGLDYCALSGLSAVQAARDSGRFVSFVLGQRMAAVFAPVYEGGGVPASLAARRARFLGAAAELFDVRSILAQAIAQHRDLEVTVSRAGVVPVTNATSAVRKQFQSLGPVTAIATAGRAGGGATRTRLSVDADGRWIVTVSRAPDGGLMTPDVQALVIIIGGLIFSVLAFVLVETLLSGRARALRAVDHRTRQLRHQSLHDSLTGLPNRQLLFERTEQLLARARQHGTSVAAMFVDIDGFKGVNDSFGHLAGDELLRTAADRIARTLRTTDIVGRIGGDEFVVLTEGWHPGEGPELLAQRLLRSLRDPFELAGPDGVLLSLTASIGVAIGDREAAEQLFRDADIALYAAKSAGKDRYAVFRTPMRVALQERVSLDSDLRRALLNDELLLFYQPTYDLDDLRVDGVEALLRWKHPTRGLLGAGEFISIAEESGLIVELGAWVLGNACGRAAAWRDAGHDLDVSVNVSARQLDDPGLLAAVHDALHASGLPAQCLTLELTETALMRDPVLTASRLKELKKLGVRIAIDDFGTGYSSLAYLQQFPVDALKIDRAFVSGIGCAGEAEALIRTLLDLAASLRLDTVAEGIEREPQRSFLLDQGCRRGQGFLFARPMAAADLEDFLAHYVPDAVAALQ